MSILKNKFVLIGIGVVAVFAAVFLSGKLSSVNPPTPTKISQNGNLDFLKISEGFKISVFAKDLEKPRVMVFDPKGTMLVSEPQEGKILKLEDKDNDGLAETKTAVIENLRLPHGLAFYKDSKNGKNYLYVAETHQVKRYEYDLDKQIIVNPNDAKIIAAFPAEGRHFTRTIGFGPNYRTKPIIDAGPSAGTVSKDKLYMSVGSSCDVCLEDSWKRAAILESDPPGNFTAEFAGGLRNAVFFAFHPVTKEMWATEMGRDNLGDDLPPDEINIVKVAGPEHKFGARRYGWPFCYGNKVRDGKFNTDSTNRIDIPRDCSETESPLIEISAHSAPLGLVFVPPAGGWPSEWQNNLLVAYHGSWNRSEPTGYKIVRFNLNEKGEPASGKYESENFISGWLHPSTGSGQSKVFGRPVDLKFGLDGALYISDDQAGIIYKVTPN